MTDTQTNSFNVLTSPWVPLARNEQGDPNEIEYASYVEILCGEKDSENLSHPRDDMRFFSRMLLSALTQALFPAKDAKELRQRIETPLAREVVMKRIEDVKEDFELLRADGFMQTPGVEQSGDDETGRLLLDGKGGGATMLFRPATRVTCLCLSCGVLAAYGTQAFAPSGGRGYSPSVRGAPPITTLLRGGTVRKSMWLSTLSAEDARQFSYGEDPPSPWKQDRREKAGELIGLVEGLFWKPRAFAFAMAEGGSCPLCGRVGERLRLPGFAAFSKVAGGSYRHPMTPSYQDTSPNPKKHFWTRNFSSQKPSFTATIDLLCEARGEERSEKARKKTERLARPAPIVKQWRDRFSDLSAALVILDYASDKASIRGRLSEEFPLSLRLTDPDLGDDVRRLTRFAEEALFLLEKHLRQARRKRAASKKDPWSIAWSDVASSFWQLTEPAFWTAFDVCARSAGSGQIDEAKRAFYAQIESVGHTLFNIATSVYENDPASLAQIAKHRIALRYDLQDLVDPMRAAQRKAKMSKRSSKPPTQRPPDEPAAADNI